MDKYLKRQKEIVSEIEEEKKKITRRIDVVEYARIIRKELKKGFPTVKFHVRTDRFAGGSSVQVTLASGFNMLHDTRKRVEKFLEPFDTYRSGLLDDSYWVGFEYEGEVLCPASFLSAQ